MEGEDDWLVRAADRELAGANRDVDAMSFEDSERFDGDSDGDSCESTDGMNWDWRDAINYENPQYNLIEMFKSLGISRHRADRNFDASSSTATIRPTSAPRPQTSNPSSLGELAAKFCAKHLAFYQLESMYRCINMLKRNKYFPYTQDVEHLPVSDTLPDTLFLKIVNHCFPSNLDDIRLYSVLASGKTLNFEQGTLLYKFGQVFNVVQIGYLISAAVTTDWYGGAAITSIKTQASVSIKVDRCRIIYTKCSCDDPCEWCRHVCALVIYRLKEPQNVQYRVTIWDAINELDDNKLKKFAQYLINELPREHLPMAQRLLDQLSDAKSEINNSYGAPDPTDGGHDAIAVMSYNEPSMHDMVRRQLQRFCMKQAVAHGIDELNATKNSAAQEFQRHLQPLANLDPSAMNNFINMVKTMLSRKDPNAISLVRIATEECIANRLVLLHWYCYKLVQSGRWHMTSDESQSRQLNIGQLCDELVNLWRRIALNPSADKQYREQLFEHLRCYHKLSTERIFKIIKSGAVEDSLVGNVISHIVSTSGVTLSAINARFTMDCFPGFQSAMKVCIAMQNLEIRGIPIEPIHVWMRWPEQAVSLLPEQAAQSPKKNTKKKNHRHGHHRRNSRGGRDARNNSRGRQNRRNRREESSESGQESDQEEENQTAFPQEDVAQVLAESYSAMDPLEARFAQCEAAATHGHLEHAVPMAMDLMKSVLTHVEAGDYDKCKPGTSWEGQNAHRREKFDQLHSITVDRIDTLEKSNLIAKILMKKHERTTQSQLFRFIVKILMCPKFPMTSKHAQVKEHYLEMELLKILQLIEIQEAEVQLLRECSDKIRDIVENEGIPPLGLAKFIFEELSYSTHIIKFDSMNQQHYRTTPARLGRCPDDDDIALAAAVNALGTRVLVSDVDYPMLMESIRSLKGHLAITLLVSFKDDKEKLGVILDRLLDPRIHQMYKKHFTNALYFLKDACVQKRYFPGQRPVFPYMCMKKKDDQLEENPNRAKEEEDLLKMMSTTMLNQIRQEASRKPLVNMSKGKRCKTRFLANSTDAYSTFMSDLGRRVLAVAGGNPTPIFAPVHTANTQKNLHICSLLISLYGLGVSNKGKKNNWITRNYSSEVSWIQQQISEIGPAGYDIIRDIYWEFHFTPSEMAQLAEKTIQIGHADAHMQACLLSLSILPYSHILSSQEIKSAVSKCKDIGPEQLERACDAIVKSNDSSGDISADILFQCAHYYEDLYKEKELSKQQANLRKASGGPVPPLQHTYSYPGASNIYQQPGQHQNQYNPFCVISKHPTSPVCGPPQGPVFPQQPAASTSRPSTAAPTPTPSTSAGEGCSTSEQHNLGLHQSHSAPQLSSSGGGASTGRRFCSRLIKAYRAGVYAMGAMMRQHAEAIKANYSRIPMYKEDVIWLCDLVIMNLGTELSFEFFEHAFKAVSCPHTLLHITTKCYQMNFTANMQDALLPSKMNHSGPLLPPELMFQPPSQNKVMTIQSLLNVPPPKVSRVRQHLFNFNFLGNRPFHPVTVDLIEKCYDQLHKAIQVRLSFHQWTENDRMEAENIFKSFLHLIHLIPNNRTIVEDFMWHAKRCKHFKNMVPRKDANSVIHCDAQVKQFLDQFSFTTSNQYPHYQNHY